MVKTITMTALLFLAGVGAVLWLMPYEWLWIVLPAVTLLLCAVSVALYWYEVRLPIGRMIASMQAMREGQAVTLDDARRDDEFGQLARAIVEFSIRNQHHLEEVRRRKDDFQRLFDMVPCGISVQDREYRLLRWNHSFAVRYDPQPGNTCYEVYKGRTTPCPECSVQRTWEEGAVQCNQESRVNPDGTRDYWFVQTVPLFDKDGNVSSVMEMSIDMTLIHTLQHQLQASERTHKAIFDSIPNAVFLLDAAELTILDCNPASVKMYGRQRENELIGRGILDLFLPEEREQYASQLRAFTVFSGVTNIKADGTPLRVDIRSASAMIENRRVRILCATDVTERIEMEQKFIQAGKMATLGEMATGVAHELNQPLTVIKGAASYFLPQRTHRAGDALRAVRGNQRAGRPRQRHHQPHARLRPQIRSCAAGYGHQRRRGAGLRSVRPPARGARHHAGDLARPGPAARPRHPQPSGTGDRQPHPQRPGRRGGTRQKRARTARRHRRLHGYGRQHGAAVRLGYRDRHSRPPAE